ncbi:MAG: DUF2621 family protein [Candidatus Omnitrophica bacterium]|nr:DUF2621 family protein [Candidatus Omnitrophota bacterium]
MDMQWDEKAKKNFDEIISQLPQFHRSIAEQLVKEKSEIIAQERNASAVEAKDVVSAFFQEVPPAFKDMMKRLMSKQGIDYSEYAKD